MKNIKKASSLAMAVVFLGMIVSCSADKNKQTETPSSTRQVSAQEEPQPNLRDSSGPTESKPPAGDWEESFKFVRDTIRTEPSRFPLKTADGVRWGRSGNSLEKALLLAQLLQESGNTVQIAEGELDDAAAAKLVGSIFPSAKTFSYKKDIPVSAPAEDPNLISAVKRHFWVQMQSEDDWVDLDPSFPGAEPRRAYAAVTNTFDPSDEALKTRASLALEYRAEDSQEDQAFLSWEGTLEDIANQPLSLSIVAQFQAAEAEEGEEEEEAAGGVFGALGGQTSKKKKGQVGERVSYNAALMVRGEGIADGKFEPGKEPLSRLILRIKFMSQEEVVSETERVLFERTEKKDEPPIFQRHAILITGNRIPAEVWQSQLKAVSDQNLLAEVKSQVEEIKQTLKAKKFSRETLAKSVELEERMGPNLGHLVNMIFASTSDDQTEKEGVALSVASYFSEPRILITTVQGDQQEAEVMFDLRQDKVEAIPFPGQANGIKGSFLYGRGVMESIMEGKLLELVTGKKALTTAVLMQEADRKNIPVRMYSSLEKENIRKIGLPAPVEGKVLATLDSGRIVALPEKSLVWNGKNRWGWWDINPRTMETVGVLDSGLHQAVLDMSILEAEGPLQTKAGFVIGAIVGAVDTQWMIAGMVLKYGELNKAALMEAKAYMKEIDALMCPGFEKKIGWSAGVTLIEIEDCWKYEIGVSAEAGIEIKQGWCENFAKGFACASTTILNYYLSQFKE